MTDSMIERVARAILRSTFATVPGADALTRTDMEWARSDVRAAVTEAARAAIEAMREPTEEMQEAALRTIVRENKGIEYGPSLGWKAMIDAALAQPPKPR